jgi:hypothetical protein
VEVRLGEILVRSGACPEAAVRDALKNQIIFGGRLGTNLLEIQAVTEEALAKALGRQHGLPCLFGAQRLDPAAVALVRPEIADRNDAIPFALQDRRLALVVVDPRNLAMLDEVAFATGKAVQPIVSPEARVWSFLRDHYAIERHLRGIEVDFAMKGRIDGARSVRTEDPPPPVGDLMDEGEFSVLYQALRSAAPQPPAATPVPPPAAQAQPPAPPPDEDVIELTELLEPEPEPSPLTFTEAARSLEGVGERDAIARTVLRYARSRFKRAVLLTVHRGVANGWAGLGEKLGADAVRHIHLALGLPGALETVVRTQAHFLGPLPKTEANIRLLRSLGGGVPGNAMLVPILALGRVVNVLYVDNGKGGTVDAGDVGELLILATRIAKSYDTLLARV